MVAWAKTKKNPIWAGTIKNHEISLKILLLILLLLLHVLKDLLIIFMIIQAHNPSKPSAIPECWYAI